MALSTLSRAAASPALAPQAAPAAVIVTPSYAGDLERCRLLCDTMDERVTGYGTHYILVEPRDVALFSSFRSSRREVVDERELLPPWLHAVSDPLSLFRRRIWLSLRTQPMRGWHVQQLRRIALATHVQADALVYCDSDVAFVRNFDCASLWRDGAVRLLRRDDALLGRPGKEHRRWSVNAARLLGLPPTPSPHDYIGTVIVWRRETVIAMIERIEAVAGRHWVEAMGAERRFSECTIYGRFVDEVLGGAGHFAEAAELCRVVWTAPSLDVGEMRKIVAEMDPAQVAIGVQSFIGADIGDLRRLIAEV